MRPYVEALSEVADRYVSCYPNAGLPNPLSETGYDEKPEDTSALVEEFAKSYLINLLGGCCGTTPDHIAAIVDKAKKHPPRIPPVPVDGLRISGLEPLLVRPNEDPKPFLMVGERTNVTGSPKFSKLIKAEDYETLWPLLVSKWKTGRISSM